MTKKRSKAPDFQLPDQSGEIKCFKDITGENGLVLYAYPKDNTSGCSLEAQDFRDRIAEFEKLGFKVAGLSKDSVKSHINFAQKYDLNFPLLSDQDLNLLTSLGAYGEKKSYGKTTMGTIRGTYIYDANGVELKTYTNVKAKGHAQKVLDELASDYAVVQQTGQRYWLIKTEPSAYSWDDLVTDGSTCWDGIRNYQARNNIQLMKPGDEVFIYHSVKEKRIMGIAAVTSESYPDPTTDDGRWLAIDMKPLKPLKNPVTLNRIKNEPALRDVALVKQTRLSVMPVTSEEYNCILNLSETN